MLEWGPCLVLDSQSWTEDEEGGSGDWAEEAHRHIATRPLSPTWGLCDHCNVSLSSLSSNIHNWDSHLASSSGVIAAAGTAGTRLLTPTSATATHYKHANTEAINRLDRANKIDVWLPGCLLVKFKLWCFIAVCVGGRSERGERKWEERLV